MFQPVNPETFYGTPAGQEFLGRFVQPDNDPFKILTQTAHVLIPGELRDDKPVKLVTAVASSPERTAVQLAKYAHWLNANYDPDTNTCTLYRLTDDRRIADFQEHGAITSRVVEAFGDFSVDLAIESLERTARGQTPTHVKSFIENHVEASDTYIRQLAEDYDHWEEHLRPFHQEAERLLTNTVSEATADLLQRKAVLLKVTQGLGESAYRAAVRESGNDDVPAGALLSISELTHSSIHLTTDPDYLHTVAPSWDRSSVLKVTYQPGSLPVGLGLGYINGQYITNHIMGGGEYEWYGIGQLASQPGRVEIEAVPLASLPGSADHSL